MTVLCPIRTIGAGRRAAGLYLMTLSVSVMLLVVGLSALVAVRIQRRAAAGGSDLVVARTYAQSGIELAMQWIESDPTWRTSRGEGFWMIDQPIGGGKFSLETNDLGTNKLLEASAETDSALLTGTGFKGDARYRLQVTLMPQLRALDCLEVALDAGGDLTCGAVTLTCDQTVSANGSIVAGSATGASNLEALGTIDEGGILGTHTSLSDPRTLPDSTAFDFYADPISGNGTYIDVSVLPLTGGYRVLKNTLLSPANNPYGPSNPKGIYVINLMGENLKIQECRIVGTLVLLNMASTSVSFYSNNMEAAIPNYPVLMVRGGFAFNDNNTPLSEWSTNVNFNPPGTPYNGAEDTLLDDEYPSIIKGLVYVSGNASFSGPLNNLDGTVIVGGSVNIDSNLKLTYQSTFLNDPPPGFAAPAKMVISPGTWRQSVN